MSRRPARHRSRRHGDGGRGGSLFAFNSKSRSSPCLPIAFIAAEDSAEDRLLAGSKMHWIICLQDTSTTHFWILQGYHLLDLYYLQDYQAKLRTSSWWVRYFLQTSLEENEAARKKFEQAATKMSYNPSCQIFHLKSYQ